MKTAVVGSACGLLPPSASVSGSEASLEVGAASCYSALEGRTEGEERAIQGANIDVVRGET